MRELLRRKENGLYRLLYAFLLAGIGLLVLGNVLGVGPVDRDNFLILAAVPVFWAALENLPGKGRVFCILTVLAVACVTLIVIGWETIFLFSQSYVRWCMGDPAKEPEWIRGFRLLQTAAIGAGAYLLEIFLEKLRGLREVLATGFCVWMLVALFTRREIGHLGVVFLFGFLVVVYLEGVQRRWKKKRGGSLKGQMVWISPFLVLFLLLSALMPAPDAPYDWQGVKNVYLRMKEALENWFGGFGPGNEDFDLFLSGFSEGGRLGGGVREEDRNVMTLSGQVNPVGSVYLIGKVFDTFDGRQWLQTDAWEDRDRLIDAMETLYAVRRYDQFGQEDYIREISTTIRYEDFQSEYLFAPLKTSAVQRIEKVENGGAVETETGEEFYFQNGDLRWNGKAASGTSYWVSYDQLNLGADVFEELLEASADGLEGSSDLSESAGASLAPWDEEALWKQITDGFSGGPGEGLSLEDLEAHREEIRARFLGEVTLSDKTERFLSAILADCTTKIDQLRALEKVLASMTYSDSPGSLPETVTDAGSFLDFFLLESKEGYCTYFATAFVLMARALGIPARYVQGFCAPVGQDRTAAVMSSMAHSWPEAYLEGVGWIPFEPTPGYGSLRYHPWTVRREEKMPSLEPQEPMEEVPEFQEEAPMPEEELPLEEERNLGLDWLRGLLLYGLPLLMTGILLVIVCDHFLGRLRYRKMSPQERLRVEVARNLRILSWLGVKRETWETLQELRERGSGRLGIGRLGSLEDYEDVFYGGKSAAEDMLQRAGTERKQFWMLIKKEKGMAAVLSYRIRMFIGWYRQEA